eukprot:scaffold16601_cov91-Isochrysis_galbana.AAC.3
MENTSDKEVRAHFAPDGQSRARRAIRMAGLGGGVSGHVDGGGAPPGQACWLMWRAVPIVWASLRTRWARTVCRDRAVCTHTPARPASPLPTASATPPSPCCRS